MKVLIIGSTGFIGKNAQKVLSREHDVYVANRHRVVGDKSYEIDLNEQSTIDRVLREVKPDAVISCAGIVDAQNDFSRNVIFTENLLQAILKSGLKLRRIVISGSAGEYGVVDSKMIPVTEKAPLAATSDYGVNKVREERLAYKYYEEYRLPIVVARIFNPIGPGMKEKFLIPNLVRQILDYQNKQTDAIRINRLDSARDYVAVDDISSAFNDLIKGRATYFAYNVGSGVTTTNAELLGMLLKNMKITDPPILQTSDIVEPLVAIQADISRLKEDFNWKPKVNIEKTIKEIINEQP